MSAKTARRWEQEYTCRGIPSSYKAQPSEPVLIGLKALRARHYDGLRSLDLGCGRGRNSFFLADKGFEAHCLDFVPSLIREIKAKAKKRKGKGKIIPVCRDVTRKWPYPSGFFDFAIDIYCYKHQTKKAARKKYHAELRRVLKKDAVYVLSLASPRDGFYGALPRKPDNVVLDPCTGIASALFTRADVERELRGSFRLVKFARKRKRGRMHGKIYLRETLVFVWQKK